MSDFVRLVVKELRGLARPRYLLPLLLAPLFVVVVMQGAGAAAEQASQPLEVAVIDDDDGELGALTLQTLEEAAEVTYTTSSVSPQEAMDEHAAEVWVVIPEDYTERIRSGERATLALHTPMTEISFTSTVTSARTAALVEAVNARLSAELTGASAVELDPVENSQTTYVRGTRVDASPGVLSDAVSTRFFLLGVVMVYAIFGAGQMVIQGMGAERESRTLETLLTMPVKRQTIIAAKLTSSALLGLFIGGVYTLSIYYARPTAAAASAAIPQLTTGDYALIGVLLALAIVDILALALWLGVFADDSRGAQTLIVPLALVTMAPVFVTQFLGLDSFSLPAKAALYAIPSTYPVVAPQRLLFGDTGIVYAGIAYEVVFAVVMIWLTVRLFNSDRLVTGDTGRVGALLGKIQR